MSCDYRFLICWISIIIVASVTIASVNSSTYAEAKKINLGEGEKIKVKLDIEKATKVKAIAFSAKRIGDPNPFGDAYSRVPITVEIHESHKLVGSESFTAQIGDDLQKLTIDMSNEPKVNANFNLILRFDVPEDKGQDRKIRIDTESIKVIDNRRNDLDIIRIVAGN
jgi:hypothetical protein